MLEIPTAQVLSMKSQRFKLPDCLIHFMPVVKERLMPMMTNLGMVFLGKARLCLAQKVDMLCIVKFLCPGDK